MDKNPLLLALYEISMSIGNTFELDKMLNESMRMMLSRLNCSSAAIYRKNGTHNELLYAKPKVLIKNDTYSSIVKKLEKRFFKDNLKVLVEKVDDKYYYFFELKNFGYFVLSKSEQPLDNLIVNSMKNINLKLVNAIEACEAHASLKEYKARLSEVQSITHLGSWVTDFATKKTYWDDELFRILGEEPQRFEPTYKKLLQHLTPEFQKKVCKVTKDFFKGNRNRYKDEIEIMRKNGTQLVVEVQCKIIYNQKGEAISFVGTILDITDRKENEKNLKLQRDALEYQAYHDVLTGLPNRLLFLDRLNQNIYKAHRNKSKIAVLFVDMDRFKEINDSLGHAFGDETVKEVGKRLENQIRETDTLARFGGDEFIIICNGIDNPIDTVNIVEKVIKSMNEPFIIDGHSIYISLSIGISIYPDDTKMADDLLKNADAAMYKAKNDGRNTYCFYTEDMTEKAYERLKLEASLRRAIENEEFILYFQPQFNAKTDQITGMETLIRWKDGKKGFIAPNKFIPIAEDTGLIIPLGYWVMKKSMQHIVKWHNTGLTSGIISINISMVELQNSDYIFTLQQLLDETSCKPQWLEIEITESQVMKNPEQTILTLEQISQLGIKIAIDDFGTGYSSLSYLKRLPINRLKIDRSFIKDIPNDEEDVEITKAIIALTESLHLDIIAEGVETMAQKEFLVKNGCENVQGYLYAKPMPEYEIEKLLKGNSHYMLKSTIDNMYYI